MKLHVPHPHTPAMFHRHHDAAAADAEHPHKFKDGLVHVHDGISHAVEHTLDVVEHGVDAVDPLHVFSPKEIATRLIYKEGMLSQTGGESFPILCARSNDSYHNLQIKAINNNEFVIENATTKKPVMVLTHTSEQYDIYVPTPVVKDQQPATKEKDLYHRAKVVPSDSVLQVILVGHDEPTYLISKAGFAKSYSTGTKHFIQRIGEKGPVASTNPWEGKTDMMEVQPGEDSIFMYCLALIADEMLK
jgi:hypothetical protein